MAVPQEIQPYAALAELGQHKSGAAKWGLTIKAPELTFNTDEKSIALLVGQAIQTTLRENLSTGKQPDGSPMPQASAETIKRREYRRAQMARGASQLELTRKQLGEFIASTGQREQRGLLRAGTSDKARSDRREIRRRFKSAGMKGSGPQGVFMPHDPSTFGLESGLMAASVRIRYTPPRTVDVFFSDKRGSFAAKRDGKTAVQRVFERVPIWSQRAMQQPRMQEALKQVPSLLIRHRTGGAILNALLKGLEAVGREAVAQLDRSAVD